MAHTRWKLASFIFDNSLLLLVGTTAAVVWANLDLTGYNRIAHPLHFWVNDVGMVCFFALAAKEVFEATLRGARLIGGRLPPGLQVSDLIVVGIAASIGFTVSLFFATAAFSDGAALAETK